MKEQLPQEKSQLELNFMHVTYIEFKNMDGELVDIAIIDHDKSSFQEDLNGIIDRKTFELSQEHQDEIFAIPLSAFRTTKKWR